MTFEKGYARHHPEAEFVAPGHPLLEAINQTILTTFGGEADNYAVFGDPEGQREGVFWFVQGEVSDGTGQPAGKRVFCLYQAADGGTIQPVNSAILWDHEPLTGAEVPPAVAGLLRQREITLSPTSCFRFRLRLGQSESKKAKSKRSTACARWII